MVYLRGEVTVELAFDPPARIDGDDPMTTILVEIDPLAWFTAGDGAVEDPSVWDFGATGEVLDFEAKMTEAFTKIELGR